MYKTIVILFFTGILYQSVAQQPQTLQNKSYEELTVLFEDHTKDREKAIVYAKAYLQKAKQEKDIIKQADGYYMLAGVKSYPLSIKYADSIIKVTKNIENFVYPAEAYLLKAGHLGANGKYSEAMEALVKANSFANNNNNIDQQHRTKYFIALLKNNLGEFDEALNLFVNVNKYYEEKYNNDPEENRFLYLMSIYALGDSYLRNEMYNKAEDQNGKGIKISLNSKDSLFYSSLLLLSGSINYHTGKYNQGLDSLFKFRNIYKEKLDKIKKIDVIESDFYLGRIYYEKGKIDSATKFLREVDSLIFERQHFSPDLRPTYETLIESYKRRGNIEKQLYYINRLLKFDSIVDKDVKYLYRKINKEYSTPNLLAEKQKLIDGLQERSKYRVLIIGILIVLSIFLIFFLYRNIQKRKIYQYRFQELFREKEQNTSISKSEDGRKSNQDIGISEEIVEDILKSLDRFEEKEDFLKSNITVSSLSKKLGTNSKYLSKTINAYKHKSFSNYINDLRINFVVHKLKEDTLFRKYTIKAIADECGFNTTEAFSKSFYKTTGIYPSYFLKELEKKEQNIE